MNCEFLLEGIVKDMLLKINALFFQIIYQVHRNSQYIYLIPKNMKRPQSAKPGFKGYWGQSSADDINEQSVISKNNANRKQVKIMKPDLTTHDFARILPKKIHQDKERLYSEALQLKQSLNEVMEENIRLKTKISILQKEKDKMNRYLETAPEGLTKQGNSRLNLYGQKSSEKENNIIRTLKKIVRESKQEVEYLKVESQKIKKTMKYTKMNQLQIERKTVMDENKKLATMLQQYRSQIINQDQLERQNEELKRYLEQEIQQNRQLSEQNQKYQEIVESLEEKIRSQNEKFQNKEKKLTRDLALEKRKAQQQQKHIEDLRKQLKNLQNNQEQAINMKKKQNKPLLRPGSSNPNNYKSFQPTNPSKENTINVPVPAQEVQTEQIKLKNEQLQKELKEIRLKLEQSQNQLNKKKVRDHSLKENIHQKSELVPQKPTIEEKPIFVKKEQQNEKANKTQSSKLEKKYDFSDSPKKEEESYGNSFEPAEQSYEQQFEKPEQAGGEIKSSKKVKENEQIQKFKKDFQQNQEEQQIYKKDQKSKKQKGDDKKKKQKKQPKGDFKPDKKILSEIKELLTYRMKSQRYPFEDLKADIQTAESPNFTYSDLCNMLVNQPFYLTSEYTKSFLCYCYQKQKIDQTETLQKSILVTKLRKVVDNFELMEQNQQKEMILRIAEMTSTYPYELETAFENIKNGEQTVAKKDVIEMFQKLELEDKYIELIISELSLCSDDLEHLNFHGFFQRFYVEEDDGYNENNAIEEQGEESEESHKNTSRIKKQSKNIRKPSDQLEEKVGKYMMAPQQNLQNKNYAYDEEDIVSDDGRI